MMLRIRRLMPLPAADGLIHWPLCTNDPCTCVDSGSFLFQWQVLPMRVHHVPIHNDNERRSLSMVPVVTLAEMKELLTVIDTGLQLPAGSPHDGRINAVRDIIAKALGTK